MEDNNAPASSSRLKSSMGRSASARLGSGQSTADSEPRHDKPVKPKLIVGARPSARLDNGGLIKFSRCPRMKAGIEREELEIALPPIIGSKPEISWLSTLLPVIGTLCVAAVVTLLMKNLMMLVYTLPMTVIGLIVSVVNYRNQIAKYKETVMIRQEKYEDYIAETERFLIKKQQQQINSLNNDDPATAECFSVVEEVKSRLWNRTPADGDFMSVRIGHGAQKSCIQLKVPREEVSLDQDPLRELPRQLYKNYHQVENVPIKTDILRNVVCGIIGNRADRLRLIENIVVQLTTHHCYTELKLICIQGPEDESTLSWMRDLPHCMDSERSRSYIAQSKDEADALLKEFNELLEARAQSLTGKKEDERRIVTPFYLFIVLEPSFIDDTNLINRFLFRSRNLSVGTIIAADAVASLPKECNEIMEVTGRRGQIYCKDRAALPLTFTVDDISGNSLKIYSKKLGRIVCEEEAKLFSLPKSVSFLKMYGVNTVEELEPLWRWKNNDTIKSLSAPVGIGMDGETFYLDVHENAHGPHGLVAGTTGSGKSQFLQTYILSLAVNYHPDEVAFVLIDYKGGSLTGAFDDPDRAIHLPHLIATITNLDGATIKRSLDSIKSELERRQIIFNRAKSLSNVSTLDIYDYQKLYREKKVTEPLPHLFIISDEFAELKQQQPEFMDQLISIARIGRSLGVHMILATQQPGGIVNDQILSNTRFKACFKVRDPKDSTDVLGRQDAAALKDVGRFYLQVGYDELFAMGQSAWAGAPYTVQREADAAPRPRLRGSLVNSASAEPPNDKDTPLTGTELLFVVKLLSETAEKQGIPTRSLWKPELKKLIPIESLNSSGPSFCVSLGMIDDPKRQQQFPLTIDLVKSNHILIVGDSGSGKTQICQALLMHLLKNNDPSKLNFYVLDYSSHLMKLMKGLPQCGAVLTEDDFPKLKSFFELINSIITERKALFSELEVDSYESASTLCELPLVLVVIDNLSALSSSKETIDYIYKLPDYMKDSAKYGVIYIITSKYLNDVPTRIRQSAGTTLALWLKDKYDYQELLNCPVESLPPAIPGRGLYNWDGSSLEMQLGSFGAELGVKDRVQMMKQLIAELSEKYSESRTARRLPVYSRTATYEEFSDQFKRERLPIGFSKTDGKPVAIPLKQFSMLSVYLGNPLCAIPITENLLYGIKRERAALWIVKAKNESLFNPDSGKRIRQDLIKDAVFVEPNQESITSLWRGLSSELTERKEVFEKACAEKGIDPSRDDVGKLVFRRLFESTAPIFILFENLSDFCLACDSIGTMVFNQLFQIANRRNIYFIGLVNPGDCAAAENNTLFRRFNPDNNIILLGGQTDKQSLCDIPSDILVKEILPLNEGIMVYQNGYYPVLMPCGEIAEETIDEDDINIFGETMKRGV